MKSLTCCQAIKTRVGRRNTKVGSGMNSLTHYKVNRTRVGVRTVKGDMIEPGMGSLTACQINRTRVGVWIVRRDIAGPGMESLTAYQANRTRVGMRIVRRDTIEHNMESLINCSAAKVEIRTVNKIAGPDMEPLTCCQANRTRVGGRMVRRYTADMTKNHSLAVKLTGPEVSEKEHESWHGITHSLPSQQNQSGSEDSEIKCN